MIIQTLKENPAILEKVNSYWLLEAGEPLDATQYEDIVVAIDLDKVVGVYALRKLWDVAAFHTKSPKAAAALFQRLMGWAKTQSRDELSVFIAPEAEKNWQSVLKRINATPANRYLWNPPKES